MKTRKKTLRGSRPRPGNEDALRRSLGVAASAFTDRQFEQLRSDMDALAEILLDLYLSTPPRD